MYDPKREYNNHKEEIDNAIFNVVNNGNFINGKEVNELEMRLKEYVDVNYCVCVSSGTDALLVALLSLGIKPEDEVITVSLTWISSSEVISLIGAKPVFVDVDDIYCIDVNKIEDNITSKTKAILAVNLYGNIPDYNKIRDIADKYNLYVIEDAAQSFGSMRFNKKSCSFGDIGCTSFFPSKPLGCYGDGGACFTNDKDLYMKIKSIANHGGLERFKHNYIGLNARLDTIQASILLTKLNWFDETIIKRSRCADYYLKNIHNINIKLPKHYNDINAWAQFTLLCNTNEFRDKLYEYLKQNNINISIFYPIPLHYQKCFNYLGYVKGDLPFTEDLCKRIINIPCYAELTIEEQDYIIKHINEFIYL